jgi:hypothetical protein
MNIAIIGLGKSCPKEKPKGIDIAIGVNDAPDWCDAIVVVDPPRVFNKERWYSIVNHKGKLYTYDNEWNHYRKTVIFKLNRMRHDMSTVKSDLIPQSFTSIIPAIGVACWIYDNPNVYLYGVDLINHHALSDTAKTAIIAQNLKDLAKRIPLYFGAIDEYSQLIGCLPLRSPESQSKLIS